jgi:hypothetical protein
MRPHRALSCEKNPRGITANVYAHEYTLGIYQLQQKKKNMFEICLKILKRNSIGKRNSFPRSDWVAGKAHVGVILMSGKMSALVCRKWHNRVKGRGCVGGKVFLRLTGRSGEEIRCF